MGDLYACDREMAYQQVMFDIKKTIRTQILKQISQNSTLIYQYLLPLNIFIVLLIIMLSYN